MSFFEFYNQNFIGVTIVGSVLFVTLLVLLIHFCTKVGMNQKIKTPWFEIAPDSVNIKESDDVGKTRLLLKRQMDFVDNFINGIQPLFQAIEKEVVDEAMESLFVDESVPKTHMRLCLIQSSTNELVKDMKVYLNSLLVLNHIGTDKEKIVKYAKNHTSQLIGIAKKSYSDTYSKLSGNVLPDMLDFCEKVGLKDPNKWVEEQFINLLISISELRYSDFGKE